MDDLDDLDDFDDFELDTSEREEPSEWEERFESQINAFFDEAIERVPGFTERHLESFRSVMTRSLSPKTGLGDVLVSLRNLASGVSSAAGGPDFSRESFTHEELTEAFEREVVSTEELESLLNRLFREFERDQWKKLQSGGDGDGADDGLPSTRMRERVENLMEEELAHDPLLAQAVRSGVKIGLPATLGYVLFGKVTLPGGFGSEAARQLYKRRLDKYRTTLMQIGRFKVPGWVGAIGWAGGLVGTLAVGGLMEFAVNSIRDLKGAYIRQLNAARYAILYGEDPETPAGQGVLHIVRGLERQFDRLASLSEEELQAVEREVAETTD
ncbi:MAG: hypothetical protein ABEL76_10555 [Bradymonadaceae bacterium]